VIIESKSLILEFKGSVLSIRLDLLPGKKDMLTIKLVFVG